MSGAYPLYRLIFPPGVARRILPHFHDFIDAGNSISRNRR